MKGKLTLPCLCLVTDRGLCRDTPLEEKVAQAVEGGVNLVQLREKDLPGGELLRLGERLREVTRGRALLFVNERVDVALLCGADGVQLGEEALPAGAVRRLVGDGLLIGRSVHSLEGALQAQEDGADLLVVGTIFPTASHPGTQPAGVGLLSEIARRVAIPLLAIGGVKAGNAPQVIEAGASGAAVISAILASPEPKRAAQELWQALQATWQRRKGDRG
jgi:thiamine-phosphate pyrophosphorylase